MSKLADEEVPEVWRKLGDAAARRLVRAEARNLVSLRTVVRSAHAELLGHLSTSGRRADALAALRHATTAMGTVVADGIVAARDRARDAALEQTTAEVNRLGAELRAAGFRGTSFDRFEKVDAGDDAAAADAVSRSFAARWAQNVLAVIVAAEDDEDPKVALRARLVAQRLDKRIGVVAATETARAFNDQHERALASVLEPDDEGIDPEALAERRRWLPLLFKRWSAVLDRKTCAECRDLDGSLALPWGEFPGHEADPPLHPYCRCVAHLVLLPIPIDERDPDVGDESLDDVA